MTHATDFSETDDLARTRVTSREHMIFPKPMIWRVRA